MLGLDLEGVHDEGEQLIPTDGEDQVQALVIVEVGAEGRPRLVGDGVALSEFVDRADDEPVDGVGRLPHSDLLDLGGRQTGTLAQWNVVIPQVPRPPSRAAPSAVRASGNAAGARFNEMDHVMTYFYTDPGGMEPFLNMAAAVGDAGPRLASAPAGQRLTYCFLDEDPVATAARLTPVLAPLSPLFAAPLHAVVPHQWDRCVPDRSIE